MFISLIIFTNRSRTRQHNIIKSILQIIKVRLIFNQPASYKVAVNPNSLIKTLCKYRKDSKIVLINDF